MSLATLRSNVETALTGRVFSPFTYRDRKIVETVPAGIPEIDSLSGGLPRGSLTEICGLPCSGLTTFLFSALATRTAQSEACALIDGHDAFYPHSAEAAGVTLKNLLWVRCRNVEQSLRAADLILHGGGFGMVALDLSDIPSKTVRYVPLSTWFRFRRIVENTTTILLLLERESNAKTCASLVLHLGADSIHWKRSMETADFQRHPFAYLLDGFQARAEVLRSRIQPVTAISARHGFARAGRDNGIKQFQTNSETIFNAKTTWGYVDNGSPATPQAESIQLQHQKRFTAHHSI
jgi:hypothetical protein